MNAEQHTVTCLPELVFHIDHSLDETTKLIYGKNPLDKIVNISYKNNNIHIFREIDGVVSESIIQYKHWILNSVPTNGVPLSGINPLKFLQEFNDETTYKETIKEIWGKNSHIIHSVPEAFMTRHGYTYFKNIKVDEVSCLSFDIETSGLNKQDKNAKVFLITNYYRSKQRVLKKTFNVDDYTTDKEMILSWCTWVREIDPSFLVCHNGIVFDLPYLHEIAGGLPLGRDGSNAEIETKIREKRKDGSQSYSYQRINVFGRDIVDTFFLSLTYDNQRKFESYALKTLIRELGLEKKDRTFIDASRIAEYWNTGGIDKQNVITYAEEDAEDAIKLYDKFAAALFYFTQSVPKTFQLIMETATGSQINSILIRSYLQNNESIPKPFNIQDEHVEGGISFGIPGIYSNINKLDLASAYPSQIVRLKLYNKLKDPKANFYNLVKYFMYKRFEYKKKEEETKDIYWKNLNDAGKIIINSAYGVCNTNGLNFNDVSLAKTITKETRELIDLALRWSTGKNYFYWINQFYEKTDTKLDKRKYLNVESTLPCSKTYDYIPGPCDTDSISFSKKTMEPFTKQELIALQEEINALSPDLINWGDDGYYDGCLVLKAKNYVLKQGTKYIKKGSALKSSKLEPVLKRLLDELIRDSLENKAANFQDIYHKYIKLALNPTDIKDWCQKKTVTKPILACAENPESRKNESDIWNAIKHKQKQEGDKIFVYPTIVGYDKVEKVSKKGVVTTKEIAITGLKCAEDYKHDANVEKLVDRVYATVLVFSNVVGKDFFTDYSLVENKPLLEQLR